MARLLDEYEEKTGISVSEIHPYLYSRFRGFQVPIHVDGASGAFFAPFATPKLVWDFRVCVPDLCARPRSEDCNRYLELSQSIHVSEKGDVYVFNALCSWSQIWSGL